MCTVTYLPLDEGFILTSNRDERLVRSQTEIPKRYDLSGQTIFFPKDKESTGTWIATSAQGLSLCLLNGAFEKHESKPPYRKSRGLVLLEFFKYRFADDFLANFDLNGIEPFTLIIACEQTPTPYLYELRWDGENSHLKPLDPAEAHIWSSATLYTKQVQEEREMWFKKWLQENSIFTQEAILFFHHFAGRDDHQNALVMTRDNDRQTISITSVLQSGASRKIVYEDLINQKIHRTHVY
ncbi:MAG TPA: NRDE family protein [Catalimonadaceae bacterium]|nr:NRDE family protein [Catalimonadaceae bacterium]HPI09896.1 NRDE family protein [Catalimonadaceae bacterium]